MLILTFARRFLCQFVGRNVAVTAHVRERIDLPNETMIHHGVPDLGETADKGRKNLFTFAFVGRLVTEKGLKILLRAVAKLRGKRQDFRVWLVGDGPQRQELEELTVSAGIHDLVEFRGFLSGADLNEALAQVDAVVMPSICEETAGLAAMEQMMRGKLVIASDIGGLGEVVSKLGLKFTPGDSNDLADVMETALAQPGRVRALGLKARAYSKRHYTSLRMAAEHFNLYKQEANAVCIRDRA